MENAGHVADIAVVGAGIVGLAHALAAAKQGKRVVVFERHARCVGASIRNFGMVWPIGQPTGPLLARALRSREIWMSLAEQARFHINPCGSLHVAYRPDELAVLEEFVAQRQSVKIPPRMLTAEDARQKSPAVSTQGLLGALWSETEAIVDPREAIAKLPDYLNQVYGVEFHFNTVVTDIAHPTLIAGGEQWTAEQILVCSGADFETLYPEVYNASNITKVKLQMMRTAPQPEGFNIGVPLCGGLTLTHYAAFADCSSLGSLKTRIEQETPHFPQWGIHVMVSQNASGELIIGDTHEYGNNPDPFDRAEPNRYILDYLKGFTNVPSLDIAETWHGVYAKLPGKTEFIAQPEPGVTIVTALSGAGMTLSFGLAEEVIADLNAD
ncbi:fad dependent oxidoreductase [Leptolyngbya sp. Heron Island J]|uniref:TIGR03364 family FAD-dependent oxidoreductase n=1 Tax=Leptolyngbya sp. Heron Island J TaxID=1385935 RepID=UPI0003B9F8FE|nr:TIGR03364 family FAD-dependent oxidoreductase [Leptolyngbya sp. Heron Island J]ESA33650.1 fad dependent oxidoreductase [Leptolyngbya sp. Heron Island J]